MPTELNATASAIRCYLADGRDSEPAATARDVRDLRARLEQQHGYLREYVDALVAFEKRRGLQALVARSQDTPRVIANELDRDISDAGIKLNRTPKPSAEDPDGVLRFYAFLCEEEARLAAAEQVQKPANTEGPA